MTKLEIENKIVDLKGKQAAFFKVKKRDKNDIRSKNPELIAVRRELNDLKQQVKAMYRA